MRRTRIGWLALAAVVAACEQGTEPQLPTLAVEAATLEARGDTTRLVARVDGEVVSARWESLDPDRVAVSAEGLASALMAGSARVRATLGDAVATGTVTVLPPVEIRVSELAQVTEPGGARGVRMRLRNAGGRGYYRLELWKLDPDGSKRRIVWYVDESEAGPGLDIVHENFLGEEIADWVVAYSREPLASVPVRTSCVRMDGLAEPCPSDLPDPSAPVDSVAVWPAAGLFDVGDTVQYVARAYAADVEVTGRPVVWSTPSPDVIALSESGVAVALKPGYGQVNATVDGVTTGVGLTVASPEPGGPEDPVSIVTVRPNRLRLWAGQGWHLAATAYGSAGQPVEGADIAWSVLDPTVASVDGAGMVAALGHGRTHVVATAGGVYGYAVVESYARPEGRADLELVGLTSAAADPSTVMASIDTTWVDGAGTVHDAWIQVRPGSLSLDWSDGGHYSQRLTMTTYVYEPGSGVRKVAESEYVDAGALEWRYDWGTGEQRFDFRSAVTEGLTYTARWSIPGELAVEQTVGSVSKRTYYFRLPL